MTDPMGKYWNQPKTEDILIDDTHAVVTADTFDQLANYSHSIPTGVYPGKMWKCAGKDGDIIFWWLRWYGISDKPNHCSFNERIILILRP